MRQKVILISIDGMRPDGFLQCNNPFIQELMKKGSYTLEGSSMIPSVTLPCHMSIFHSVTPQRHGMTTNNYMPMVRPVNSLFQQIQNAGGRSAMYYGWEPLRDVATPGTLKHAEYIWAYTTDNTDRLLTESALTYIKKEHPDFVFLYMVETDEKGGHDRIHGTELPEDMTIPMFFIGPDFEAGKMLSGISLLDLAPTIATIMGAPIPREWEGKSIVEVEK